jgi:hypothetical protein
MGLKGLSEVKKVIGQWFPECKVKDVTTARNSVTIVVEDMSLKINNIGRGSYSINNLKRDLKNYPRSVFSKFPACKVLISLIDDSNHTPSAKVPTQKKRGSPLEPCEIAGLGHLSYLSNHGIDVAKETAALKTYIGPKVKNKNGEFNTFMNLLMATRARKVDTTYFFTRELLSADPYVFSLADRRRSFILDGAIWPMSETQKRAEFLNGGEDGGDFGAVFDPSDTSGYSYIHGHMYDTCATIMDANGARYMRDSDRPCLGEADIKIIPWLRRIINSLEEEEETTIMITCCDTDLLVIILLWIHEIIDPNTGHMTHRILLDCTSRSKGKDANKRLSDEEKKLLEMYPEIDTAWEGSMEIYNMNVLWRLIHTRFMSAFPGMANPVETFCLACISGGTDFVEKPNDLGMGSLWKAFCAGGYAFLSRAVVFSGSGDNSDRRLGVVENYVKEFYRFAYAVRNFTVLMGQLEKEGDKALAERLNERMKHIVDAQKKVTKRNTEIANIEARIAFERVLMDAAEYMKNTNEEGRTGLLKAVMAREFNLETQVRYQMALTELQRAYDSVKTDIFWGIVATSVCNLCDCREYEYTTIRKRKTPTGVVNRVRECDGGSHMATILENTRKILPSMEAISQIYQRKREEATSKAIREGKEPPRRLVTPFTQEQLDACCRTIVWNMDYWFRCPALETEYVDVSTEKGSDGASLYGWEKEETLRVFSVVGDKEEVVWETSLEGGMVDGGTFVREGMTAKCIVSPYSQRGAIRRAERVSFESEKHFVSLETLVKKRRRRR